MGGIDNFSAEESLLIIGEMYVLQRRQETREEILVENIRVMQARLSELETDLALALARVEQPVMTGDHHE